MPQRYVGPMSCGDEPNGFRNRPVGPLFLTNPMIGRLNVHIALPMSPMAGREPIGPAFSMSKVALNGCSGFNQPDLNTVIEFRYLVPWHGQRRGR
jgi:hypothetical protein